ncbi:MAG: sensor histidine kinase [Haloferacaceae archaeon]
MLGTGVAVGAGAAQLYRSARRHPPFAREAFVGLTLPVLLPYLARYVYQFGLILDFATVELLRSGSLLVGLAGLYVAVSRYDVFEQLPASQTVSRETAFGTTETPVVLLYAEDRVADLNPAACSLFGVTSAEVVGGPVEALLPATVDADAFRDAGRITFQFPHSDRMVESETTVTVSDGGREIGRTIVCNDITEERRRQQRIQVLNRALRHNLRNDLTAARGYVEMLTEAGDEAESHATRVLGILDGMADLGVKARDIEQVLAADADVDEPVSLAAIVEQAAEDARSAHGDASITTAVPDDVRVAVDPVVLRSVLRELLENAAVHTDGTGIEVAFVDAEGDIVVSDDGPGIPEYETEVFEIEEETSLKHGSGLGLWLVKWGVDRFGGTVRFDTSGTGTRVHVSIPDNLLARRAPAAD